MTQSEADLGFTHTRARKIVSRCVNAGQILNKARRSLTDEAVGNECFFFAADRLQFADRQQRKILLDLIDLCVEEGDFFKQAVIANANGRREDAERFFQIYLDSAENSQCLPEMAKNWKWLFDHALEPFQLNTHAPSEVKIFQYWDKDVPVDVTENQNKWKQVAGPGLHRVYNDEEARDLVGRQAGSDALKLYDKCWAAAIKSDLFRYAVLHEFGGFYVDSDLTPLPTALDYLPKIAGNNVVWGRNNISSLHITTSFMSSIPKWTPLSKALDISLYNLKHHIDWDPMKLAGPFVLTDVLRNDIQIPLEFSVLSNGFMRQRICKGYRAAYKQTAVHWKISMPIEKVVQCFPSDPVSPESS